jgi:hypothetical protein
MKQAKIRCPYCHARRFFVLRQPYYQDKRSPGGICTSVPVIRGVIPMSAPMKGRCSRWARWQTEISATSASRRIGRSTALGERCDEEIAGVQVDAG